MNVVGMGMPPQQNPQQQQQQQQQQQPPLQQLDNISKIRTLIGPLRESLSVSLISEKYAGITLIVFFRIPSKAQHKL